MDKIEKRKRFLVNTLYFVLIAGLVFLTFRYAFNLLAPFLVAFIVAVIVRPVVDFLAQRCKLPRGIASIITVVLFYSAVVVLIVFVGTQIVSALESFAAGLPGTYRDQILPAITNIFNSIVAWTERLEPSVAQAISDLIPNFTGSLGSGIASMSASLISLVSGAVVSLPGLFIKILFAIISTVFIAADYAKIKKFISMQLSERARTLASTIKNQFAKTILMYLKSYALIMFITYVELTVGLLILGVNYAPIIAAIIAVLDILPVLGSGGVLIPWSIISLVQGRYGFGIGMLVFYVLLTVIRNIIEPKIIGDQVGMHPLVTLMCMVVGVYLFGGIGIIALPVLVAIIVALNRSGTLHLFRFEEPDEEAPQEAPRSDVQSS